ncbi:hypothetical protein ACH95_04590 [Bacillus glycinifermentans]|uniref:Uncharacterized protein n=1 Tax=Bacillus glycinifermentans TaxID=1664069 RepID=A0A0J6F1N1_9BACI|nr:hypothetical protein [Bacillus glycinifermentans]ATH91868.1 hypothetical protein COP00_03905 [Bacillus glycinifermentans]KMM62914.1 hypothetical protein ACH95_04590 [Bacillus glycinifermentans]KRT92904.1 hypothetical protein AB447_221745 [Bacillus glycinifermentans]MEC0486274.1 hypothetical protein [Bacillus glycinifermentans]MEC0494988.1 hypothetical protein [Bacillus glycinifermentans]
MNEYIEQTTADIAKESISSMIGDILVDAPSFTWPQISGAVQSYKRARFEKNSKTFTEELHSKIEEVRLNLELKTFKQEVDLYA